jgi:hypothetical protein
MLGDIIDSHGDHHEKCFFLECDIMQRGGIFTVDSEECAVSFFRVED